MISSYLHHLIIIFRTQIHEIIIHRILHFTLHMHLIMQMRSRALSCIPHFANYFATHHFLARTNFIFTQMCIPSHLAESVIDLNQISITGLPPCLYHFTVSGGIYGCTDIGRKVHSGMKLRRIVNRVDTCTIPRSCFL